jgi:hypothetical protein
MHLSIPGRILTASVTLILIISGGYAPKTGAKLVLSHIFALSRNIHQMAVTATQNQTEQLFL